MALARPHVTAKYHRLGSMVSIAPDDMAALSVPAGAPLAGAAVGPEPAVLPPGLPPHAASRTGAVGGSDPPPPAHLRQIILAMTSSDPLASGGYAHVLLAFRGCRIAAADLVIAIDL